MPFLQPFLPSLIMEQTNTFLLFYCYTLSVAIFLYPSAANSALHSIMSDQDALLALKQHITIDSNQTISTNWSAGSSICDWTGIACGKQYNRVTALDISNMGLTGTIAPQLGNLSFLVSVNLSGNNFHGELPHELSRLSRLKSLDLYFNALTGEIPHSFGSLTQLQDLFLASNQLSGTIPKEMSKMSSLQVLDLSDNLLTGTIPKEISNLTYLQELRLANNSLIGIIPEELGNLLNLKYLVLGFNGLFGSIPTRIFNISTMKSLYLASNHLSGSLPLTTEGLWLPNLEYLFLSQNNLTGVIPLFISNSSRLRLLDLSHNMFIGTIPHSLGNLRFLHDLALDHNMLTKDSSSLELEFLRPLANCKHLTYLDFSENPLNGTFPKSLGNLSNDIEMMIGYSCGISGEIPASIGNLSNLISLALMSNHLTGSLPASIASLQKLQALGLNKNKLSGNIPCSLFGLKSLFKLYLPQNMFSGHIPECIGNGMSLSEVRLNDNKLGSSIPMSLWNLKDLRLLDLSSNFLSNSLPVQVGNLMAITRLHLSMNNLSGHIPDTIGRLHNLVHLSLNDNKLEGSIPDSIGSVVSLEILDISKNELTGSIPKTLEKLRYLEIFNVSYNNLSGLVPSRGPFENLTWELFIFNKDLCGDKKFHVPPCRAASHKILWVNRPKHMLVLCIGLVAIIAAISLVAVCLICRRKNKVSRSEELPLVTAKDRISFYELQYATNGYNEKNLLGQGSIGSVYKATLRDGRVVAVKVFNLLVEGALKSFDVECEMLRNLRHRNLTQVISSCSNLDFKAIVLEFMPNGSLENWLHSGNRFLSFMERLNIMIDVASALQYLHSGYPTPVIHADLKPSNVLLDEDMVAHLSDFGIAKMLEETSTTFTGTLATFGYIAPEYGSEGLVSTKCDVYSFGIMLMEVFTRKRPNDEKFNESLTLQGWVNNYYMESAVTEIIDDGVEEEHFALTMDCMKMIMKIALNCTNVFPRERCSIGEVVVSLNKIKLKL